jgi:hypothetical protein
MIRRSRNTRYAAAAGAAGSDTDALQTDVMRFMSILGLCLMAVFALVQSIPLQEKEFSQSELEQDRLYRAIAAQQERARRLQGEVERLEARAHSAQDRKNSAQQALSSAQRQLTLVVEQTRRASSDRERLTDELEELRRRLVQSRNELAGIEEAARNKARSLSALQRQFTVEQRKLDEISRRTGALNSKRTHTPRPAPGVKRPSSVSRPGKQGFTLRFASAEALDRLVEAGTVSLYAMAGKQAWRLSLGEGRPLVAPEAFPAWFHEMSPSTVPVTYLRAVEAAVGRSARSSLIWGVQLAAATKQGIASLTRDLQGGNLVIAADGQVTLDPE